MAYCECGHSTKESHHKHYHDIWLHGEKLPPRKGDILIAQRRDVEVLVVPFGASKEQRRRAAKVGSYGNRETHYDFGVYDIYEAAPSTDSRWPTYNAHAFVARHDGRGVGIAVLRQLTLLASLTWVDYDTRKGRSDLFKPACCWSVGFVWTHRDHRRRGVASLVLTSAAHYLKVPVDSLAWVLPFEPPGKALARKLSPEMLHVGTT